MHTNPAVRRKLCEGRLLPAGGGEMTRGEETQSLHERRPWDPRFDACDESNLGLAVDHCKEQAVGQSG
ncbi:hypothetical protein N7478_005058 [Penicillium angulare]|uniref:uncharacterized protein n=1 Tax=Penicillium angulare TaxID=116970 RepID=UPI002540A09E|nr:uncharacterized protein N7478_005058 [Penicillium angulare]KAJ5279686.1 hypothetical protein N7478_005058 [Penicillium angulare]